MPRFSCGLWKGFQYRTAGQAAWPEERVRGALWSFLSSCSAGTLSKEPEAKGGTPAQGQMEDQAETQEGLLRVTQVSRMS